MKTLKLIFGMVVGLLISKSMYSTHAAAVDLTYTCLGGNQYKFVLKLYRDCAGANLGGTINVSFSSVTCGQNFTRLLNLDSVVEVSQLCGSAITNSTCNGGNLPGIEEHVYSGTIPLPAQCTDWVVSYTLCCRNNAITNVNNGDLYTEVKIDNTGGKCNNSPSFNSGIPILYSCIGDPVNFNNVALDVDGDSLTYTLAPPLSGPGTPLNYLDPTFSAKNPMFTTNGFIFDSVLGQITFTSTVLQQAVVSVLINEYDSNGTWMGSSRRDIQFILINCPPSTPPTVSGVNYDSVDYTFYACYADSFCFNVFGTSGQPGVPMTMTYHGALPGGTFDTIMTADTTFGTFCWNPGLAVGTYNFTLKSEADLCPITRVNIFNYTIVIDTNFTDCKDTTIYLDTNGIGYLDSTFVTGTNNACNIQSVTLSNPLIDCSNVGVTPVTVTTKYTNGLVKTCVSNITIIDTLPPDVICRDTTVYIDGTGSLTIDSSFIDGGTTDNCALQSIWIDRDNFSCEDLGYNPVTLYAIDIYGNIDSCIANVLVMDTISPIANCQNATIYLDATGNYTIDSSYLNNLSLDNCAISTIQLSQYNFDCSHVGTNTILMTVTDNSGNSSSCSGSITVIDTINPNPICQNITIYLDSNGNASINSSDIDNGSSDECGIISLQLSKTSFNCTNIGLNTISMIVTDNNGNIDSCLAIVTVIDTLVPFANAGVDGNACVLYSYTLNANNPSGTFTGVWTTISGPNTPTFSNINQPNATVSNLITGTYQFQWSVSNGANCNISYDTMQLYVSPTITANAGNDMSLCDTYYTQLGAAVLNPGETGVWSYIAATTVNVPNFGNINQNNTTVSNLIEGRYNFIWTVSNNVCPSDADTVLVDVFDDPSAYGGADLTLCNTNSALLIANQPLGSSSGSWSYLKGPSIPVFSNASNHVATISNLIEGSYTILWTVSNGNCPPDFDSVIIDVYDLPFSNAGPDTNLCGVYSVNLNANSPVGRSTGRWVVDPTTTPPSIPKFIDSSDAKTRIDNLAEGNYRLLWVVSNGNCAIEVDTTNITVWDQPSAIAGPDTSLCNLYNLNLYANPAIGSSQGTWRLNSSYPNPNTPNIWNPNQHNSTISGLIEGSYSLIWEVMNGPCFLYADTFTVNVYDQPHAFTGADKNLCFEQSTVIDATPVSGSASGIWKLASGYPNTPTFIDSLTTTSVSNLQEAGRYVFYWEVSNGTCPVSRDSLVINNYAIPTAEFTQDTTAICAKECIQFTNQSTIHSSDNIIDYFWDVNGDRVSYQDPEICFPYSGIFDAQLIAVSSHGCRDTIFKPNLINVHVLPIADFNVFLAETPETSTRIKIQDQSQNAISVNYSLGDGSNSSVPSFHHIYPDSGFYNITQIVESNFGCKDTFMRTILVHVLLVYTPNAFSPNGDGVNDEFKPIIEGHDPDTYLFRVYNRWGEMLFQSNTHDRGWNGTHFGKQVENGVYVWTLETKYKEGETTKDFRGHVNLIR